MTTLGTTNSVCARCRAVVPAKLRSDGTSVFLRKFCPEHGESEALVSTDAAAYIRALRFVKPASIPTAFHGNASVPCPEGCGFCSRHEQHLCMPIIEVTGRCDLACPVCLNSSGAGSDLSSEDFGRMIDSVLKAESQVDVLNLSGGEPLLHPHLLTLIDMALSRKEIVRVSVSTNGLRFLDQPQLLAELKKRNVVVSLQLDGFTERPYEVLRGRRLLREKQAILAMLKEADIASSLTMTVAGGVNDDQFPAVLDCLFRNDHILSLMVQPAAFVGRGAAMTKAMRRLFIPDVVKLIGNAGQPGVSAEDFLPLPCSHPLCFSLGFYLMLDNGKTVSIGRLTDAGTLMDGLTNNIVFGLDPAEHERLKSLVYALWSGPVGAVPDGEAVLATLRGILRQMSASSCGCFDARTVFTSLERKVKSIFIHAFQDAETFDLSRVRRCCQAYPQADGRLLPACVRNVRLGAGRKS